MQATFAQIRNAYNAVRTIDGAPGGQHNGMNLFKDNLLAKAQSYRLQSSLRAEVDASEEVLMDIRLKYSGDGSKEPGQHELSAYAREVASLMHQTVEVPDTAKLTSRAVGDEILKKIPTDLLADMGPFFEWPEEG
jgi:hypothetical protein